MNPARYDLIAVGEVLIDLISEQMAPALDQAEQFRRFLGGQVANVAWLPGIVGHALAMPDAHWGYGFPIGGVAATDPDREGVISPGGVGYDINCGVRLVRTRLREEDVRPRLPGLIDALFGRGR